MREAAALAKAKPEAGRPREKEKPGERALHGGVREWPGSWLKALHRAS